MSRLRNSPRLHKGALVLIDNTKSTQTEIAFQYNPVTMTRSLTPNMSSAEGSKTEVQRVDRPPTETIKLKAELDATDGLEVRDSIAVSKGIHPALSALEMLLYPPKSRVIDNNNLALLGTIEIVPPMTPLILFVWGPNRVLPVRITSMTIEETSYDERLNPIQATVDLDLRVLSYADFCGTDQGAFISLSHQSNKESMASEGSSSNNASFF